MSEELKAVRNLGAELGAAKAEVEQLRAAMVEVMRQVDGNIRETVRDCVNGANDVQDIYDYCDRIEEAIAEAFSPATAPTDTFTAVDMATAAAQGFRDGQAAVEQDTAQDERKTFEVEIPDISAIYDGRSFIPYRSLEAGERLMTVSQHLRIEKQLRAALTRPAQTEQQPIARVSEETFSSDGTSDIITCNLPIGMALYAAPIAQTAPQPGQSGLVEAFRGVTKRVRRMANIAGDQPTIATGYLRDIADDLEAALSAQRGDA